MKPCIAVFCLLFLSSCNSVNSFYDSVVGAGDKFVARPTFAAPAEPPKDKIRVNEIRITAPPKGTILLQGSVKYGIRNYTATYALEEHASESFLELSNSMFEIDDYTAAKAKLDADIKFRVHTGKSFLCRVTWETETTVTLDVTIEEPARAPRKDTYTASVDESLCAAAGVQLFPSTEAVVEVLQRAFDEVAAKALASS